MADRLRKDPYFQSKNLIYAFANTGKERPETLQFLKDTQDAFGIKIVWIEAVVNPEYGEGTDYKIVDFQTASRNGEPFEATIKKYGISNVNFPHCTRELKFVPMREFFNHEFGRGTYAKMLGMRFDEMRRVKRKPDVLYPLVAWMVTVREVRDYWNASPFDLKLKDYEGNCDICWKKSLRKKLTILKENPPFHEWWHDMEVKYGPAQFEKRQNVEMAHFNRNDISIMEMLKLSTEPFIPQTDPFWQDDESKLMDEDAPCGCMMQEELAIA